MASSVVLHRARHGLQLPLIRRFRTTSNQQQLRLRVHNIRRQPQSIVPQQHLRTRTLQFYSTRPGRSPQQRRWQQQPQEQLEPSSNHQPPLPVRVALVSATTALATPVFPAIGFVNLFLRVALPEARLRATISTSIGSVLSFATWTLVPAFYSVAPAILPCAIGNGLVAGATYSVIDVASGGPTSRILRSPLVAGGIGAITGFVAPYFCYGPAFSAMYGMEGITESMRTILSYPIAAQVTMGTGFVAGVSMYPLLHFPMNGIKGIHWINFSLPTLTAIALALWYVYSPDEKMYVPEGSFIEPTKVPLLDSILRYNIETGEIETYSISVGGWVGPADLRKEGEQLANILRESNDPAFDDRVVAWLDSYTFMDAASKYPDRVVSVRDNHQLKAAEEVMLRMDGIVAFILERSKNDKRSTAETEERLVQVMSKMDELNQIRRSDRRKWREVDEIEAASVAVELLLILKLIATEKEAERGALLMKDAEGYISRKHPNLVLFAEDEEIKGESIQSQLLMRKWADGAPDIAAAIESFRRINDDDKWERRRNRTIQVGTILLSIASMFMMNLGGD